MINRHPTSTDAAIGKALDFIDQAQRDNVGIAPYIRSKGLRLPDDRSEWSGEEWSWLVAIYRAMGVVVSEREPVPHLESEVTEAIVTILKEWLTQPLKGPQP